MACVQLFISAEHTAEATQILDALLEERLILGGSIIQGPARFWWKDAIVDMQEYCYVFAYTVDGHRGPITSLVEDVSSEEVPLLSFVPFVGNPALEQLLQKTVRK